MDGKEQILNGLSLVFDAWVARLAELSEETITAPALPGQWSIKDVIAHLWSWQQVSVARMHAALTDAQPEFPAWWEKFGPDPEEDLEHTNAWLCEASRDKPWTQVYDEWSNQFRLYLELARQVPEEDLLALGRYTWMGNYALAASAMGSLEHHEEHLESLNHWLLEHGRG